MEFKSPRYVYDTQLHHDQRYTMPFPSSSLSYIYFPDQDMKAGLCSGMYVGGGAVDMREVICCELEKERIREELIAEEIDRQRFLEATMHCGSGFSSSFMLGHPGSHLYRFKSGMQHIQSFVPEDRRTEMPFQDMYGGHHRDFRGFDLVPVHGSPEIQKIITSPPEEGKKEFFIGLGMPNGAKREPPPPSENHSNSKKKIKEEFSCALCRISATSEHDFNEHLGGKKHKAKMAALIRAQNTDVDTGVESIKNSKKTQTSVRKSGGVGTKKGKPKVVTRTGRRRRR